MLSLGCKSLHVLVIVQFSRSQGVYACQDWLVEKFNLDLSLVARLGGHSQPRTHRGKERFPGMTITYALIQMLEKAHAKNMVTHPYTAMRL